MRARAWQQGGKAMRAPGGGGGELESEMIDADALVRAGSKFKRFNSD